MLRPLLLFLTLLTLSLSPARAADRYWVGGTGSWNGTATLKWSLTSGGVGTEAEPTASDDVYFDANSGAVTVTVATTTGLCRNLTFTGFTGTFAGSTAVTISGNLVLAATGSHTHTGTLTFNATTAKTITSNTRALTNPVTFNGVAGSWALQDAFATGATNLVTLTAGTLNLNGFNMSAQNFSFTGTTARTVTSGAGQFFGTYAGGSTGTIANFTDITNLTLTDRPTFNFSGNNTAGTRVFTSAAFTEALSPNLNVTAGSDSVRSNGSFNNIVYTGFTGLETTTSGRTLYGNHTYVSGQSTPTATTQLTTYASTGTQTVTSAGKTLNYPVTLNGVGGTLVLADNWAGGSNTILTLTNGTYNMNGKNSTISSFALGSGTKVLAVGSGTLSVAASGATAFDGATNASGFTVTGSGTITMASSSAKTFAGGSNTYPIISTTGNGALTISGSNTFADIQSSAGDRTITLTAGTTTTVSAFTLAGTSGHPVTFNSSSAGTPATLSRSAAVLQVSNLSIKDSTATGGASFYANPESGNTNTSGNTGWIFTGLATGRLGLMRVGS